MTNRNLCKNTTLLGSEADFRAMSDAAPLGIFVSDAKGYCVYVNPAYLKIVGRTEAEVLATHWSLAIHPQERQHIIDDLQATTEDLKDYKTEAHFQRDDGSKLWVRLNVAVIAPDKSLQGYVHSVEDISARKATEQILLSMEEDLFAEKERAQVTLNSIGDAVLSTNMQGHITYLNKAAENLTGWNFDDATGQALPKVFRIINATTRATAPNPAQIAITKNQCVGLAADSVLICRNGEEVAIEDSAAPIHNREGQVTGAVIVFHDVSASKDMTQKMSHLAQHDFLTGLPNRLLLMERVSQAIGNARRHKKQVALLYMDLDFFKHVNDSLGHAIGDKLLLAVAKCLQDAVRTTDTVCRQGGDEFVVLLAEIESPEAAAHVAETLRNSACKTVEIDNHQLHASLSIGISLFPDDGDNVDHLLQSADTAMYHAKAMGRNNYQFFRAEMNVQAVKRLFIETGIRRALIKGEFLLYYQPQIDLLSKTTTGIEALVRWQDPEEGLIDPAQFIPIAEASGLIVPLGRWVLREACRQLQAWHEAGLLTVPVSVNISAVEFGHKDFISGLTQILQETGLNPNMLELELTESVQMKDAVAAIALLESLKSMGVGLAIDDFGTGYSSLSYLQRFPIDTLKIDQSFVQDLATNTDDATIVSAIIGMGRNLSQRVIAEGVETQEQLDYLQFHQCAEGQGFFFSEPLPANEFPRWLHKR